MKADPMPPARIETRAGDRTLKHTCDGSADSDRPQPGRSGKGMTSNEDATAADARDDVRRACARRATGVT